MTDCNGWIVPCRPRNKPGTGFPDLERLGCILRDVERQARVLVAEDDPAIRLLLVTVLTRAGLFIEAVSNGAEAIERLASQTYDVILLDLMMPVTSGLDVIRYLEDAMPDALWKSVIVLTAVSKADLHSLDGKPVFRLLRKPFDVGELIETVNACVAAGR
jgi:CheY-like chemotaxis protein